MKLHDLTVIVCPNSSAERNPAEAGEKRIPPRFDNRGLLRRRMKLKPTALYSIGVLALLSVVVLIAVVNNKRPVSTNETNENSIVPTGKAVPTSKISNPPVTVKSLETLPLGFTVRSQEYLDLAKKYLKPGDHIAIPAKSAGLISQAPAEIGTVLFLPMRAGFSETAEWLKYIKAADYLSSDDTSGVEEAAQIRKVADKYGKKVVIGSTGRVTLEIGDQMAQYGDVYVIQAQRWYEEDASPNLDAFLNTLKIAVEKVKSGNPNISIWVQVGRKFERGGGTAADFGKAYAAVLKTFPDDIDAMHPFIAQDAPEGSGSGSAALFEFVEMYR